MLSQKVKLGLQKLTNKLYKYSLVPFFISQENHKFLANCPSPSKLKQSFQYFWDCAIILSNFPFLPILFTLVTPKWSWSWWQKWKWTKICDWGLFIFYIGYSWSFSVLYNFWKFEIKIVDFISNFLAVDEEISKVASGKEFLFRILRQLTGLVKFQGSL